MLSLVSLSNWVSEPILETFPLLNTLLDHRITKLSVKGILYNDRVLVKTFLKSFNKAWKIGKLMNQKTFRCTSIMYHGSLIISSLFAVSYQQYVRPTIQHQNISFDIWMFSSACSCGSCLCICFSLKNLMIWDRD